jgi:hypothetical protein
MAHRLKNWDVAVSLVAKWLRNRRALTFLQFLKHMSACQEMPFAIHPEPLSDKAVYSEDIACWCARNNWKHKPRDIEETVVSHEIFAVLKLRVSRKRRWRAAPA